LGLGNETGRLSPARVEGLQGKVVISLACGSRHTCALTNQGDVYSWGDHENGVTGHGATESHQYAPRLIQALRGVNVVSIGACGFHSGAVTAEGEVYTFGEGKFGRLGHGSEANCLIPRPIEALRGKRVVIFAAGGFHSCCVTDAGHLYTFGGGEHGQLGHGDRVNRNSPTLVEALLGHVVTQISTGWSHNVCLCENEVYSWG
jgi:RCC1 and BTB domain-containing protein